MNPGDNLRLLFAVRGMLRRVGPSCMRAMPSADLESLRQLFELFHDECLAEKIRRAKEKAK